jgi:cytochrome c peroxidase
VACVVINCALCHSSVDNSFTPGIGKRLRTDPAYALRTATGKYCTTPLRGLWQHPPYFHDGSAPDLLAVVNHYDALMGLNLTAALKADLVEFLKWL